ncbi:hypothetical protein FTUN_3278 [Frigoriglobus tundricola]|uniref:Uncharacterized protein n=1 Tax=Frigoriglobus tundricola TaxID=2774151 RepID=A0A6M5YQE1_9BACT|nr:hypothetical protein FTUN_3278 [Frigoriglobus tundricola]
MTRGFINGREFEGLRDADDRFGSVLEAFRGGEYLWVPWEARGKWSSRRPPRSSTSSTARPY